MNRFSKILTVLLVQRRKVETADFHGRRRSSGGRLHFGYRLTILNFSLEILRQTFKAGNLLTADFHLNANAWLDRRRIKPDTFVRMRRLSESNSRKSKIKTGGTFHGVIQDMEPVKHRHIRRDPATRKR